MTVHSKHVEFVLARLLLVLGLPEDTRLLDLGPLCQRYVWTEAVKVQQKGIL